MTKLSLPKHMESALNDALDSFAKDGFIYDIKSRTVTHDGWQISLELDCTEQEAFNLGIKVGYRLNDK